MNFDVNHKPVNLSYIVTRLKSVERASMRSIDQAILFSASAALLQEWCKHKSFRKKSVVIFVYWKHQTRSYITKLTSCVYWAFTIDDSSTGLADRLSYLLNGKSCIFYQCVLLVVASRIFSCSVKYKVNNVRTWFLPFFFLKLVYSWRNPFNPLCPWSGVPSASRSSPSAG